MALPSKEDLAAKFAGVLKEWLTDDQFEEMRLRNRAEAGPGVCHSHDFCDANMAMHEAFTSFGVDPLPDDGDMAQENIALWNAAWDLAWREHLS